MTRGRTPEMLELDAAIGERIRAARNAAGLSMRELGRRCGVSFGCIQHIERGDTRAAASIIASIARHVQKPIDYFFVEPAATSAAPQPTSPTWQQKRRALTRAIEPHQHQVNRIALGADQIADREARDAAALMRSTTAQFFGDPPPGYSALDRRERRS